MSALASTSVRMSQTDATLDRNLFVLKYSEFNIFENALMKAPSIYDLALSLKKRPSPWNV